MNGAHTSISLKGLKMVPFVRRNPVEICHMVYTLLSTMFLCAIISVMLATCGSNSSSGGTQNPTSTPVQVQKCGTVQTNPRGLPVDVTAAKKAKDCFWQAFQKCNPATLVYSLTGVDTVIVRTFTIQKNGGHCSVLDAVQHTIVPAPLSAAKTYTCAGVTQKPDGLHFSGCGEDGDVIVG